MRKFPLTLVGLLLASQTTNAQDPGQMLFEEKCAMCHRDMGMGTIQLMLRIPPEQAKLEDRDMLPAALTEFVVRNGIGIMFPLSRAEVSDEQLSLIADYLDKNQ